MSQIGVNEWTVQVSAMIHTSWNAMILEILLTSDSKRFHNGRIKILIRKIFTDWTSFWRSNWPLNRTKTIFVTERWIDPSLKWVKSNRPGSWTRQKNNNRVKVGIENDFSSLTVLEHGPLTQSLRNGPYYVRHFLWVEKWQKWSF